MDRKQWEIINEIVDRALNLSPDHRYGFIDKRCGKDDELKKEVIEYLESIEESETKRFLEDPASLFDDFSGLADIKKVSRSATTRIGDTIANYKILDLIEHGGMGSVYKAERSDGAYQKRVALKLLKKGVDTPSNIARFKQERNILANLDHPNITNLLDGGITSDGLPFLVMDYVDGTPLLTYCDAKRCTIQERLELFRKVCEALRHAHKNAIIHRDLKPSNILITGDGKVNVLDFGIAKLMDENEDNPHHKFYSHVDNDNDNALTLKYAAPEQISGKPVTISTDIHALGVLLYELLTGVYPFCIENKRVTEIKEVIKNHRPPEPSKQVKDLEDKVRKKISERRQIEWRKLVHQLTGDLDAIVCKALFKKPDKRYSTIDKLLEDLERTKKHRPISAREHSTVYKTVKFFHRRKNELAVAVTFFLIISGLLTYHTIQIKEERNIAQQQARIADDVSGFMLELFETDSNTDTMSVASLLEKGRTHMENLENDPAHAKMLSVMGEAYMNFGEYDTAKELFQKAVDKSRTVHGENSMEYANALFKMGMLLEDSYEWTEAVSAFRKSYDLRAKILGETHYKTANVLTHLASAMRNTGKLEQAEGYARNAIDAFETIFEPTDIEILSASANLAYVLREREKYDEAESIYLEVIEKAEQSQDVKPKVLSEYYNNLGYLYRTQERYGKAIQKFRRATHLKELTYPEGHPELINTRKNLATSLYFEDSIEEADRLFKKNLSSIREKYSTQHWRTASALNTLGVFYLENRKYKAAEPLFRKSTQINRNVLGKSHLWTAYSEGLLTASLNFQEMNTEEVDSLFEHHYRLFENSRTELNNNNLNHLRKLADIYELNSEDQSIAAAYEKLIE